MVQMASNFHYSALALVLLLFVAELCCYIESVSGVVLGSRLLAKENKAWFSDNKTFAFGFTPTKESHDQYQLSIWFAQIPGDTTLVWSPNM